MVCYTVVYRGRGLTPLGRALLPLGVLQIQFVILAKIGLIRRADPRRGAAAVEFALLVPLLILLFGATAEIVIHIRTWFRLERTAAEVANVASQFDALAPADVAGLFDAAKAIAAPTLAWSNGTGTGRARTVIGVVSGTASGNSLAWNCSRGDSRPRQPGRRQGGAAQRLPGAERTERAGGRGDQRRDALVDHGGADLLRHCRPGAGADLCDRPATHRIPHHPRRGLPMRRLGRRGNIAMLVALLAVPLVGMVGIATDGARAWLRPGRGCIPRSTPRCWPGRATSPWPPGSGMPKVAAMFWTNFGVRGSGFPPPPRPPGMPGAASSMPRPRSMRPWRSIPAPCASPPARCSIRPSPG